MESNLNITSVAEQIQERLISPDATLSKGRLQPFNSCNSGSRKIMQGIQKEQGMQLEHGEPAIISTGDENQFGEFSSSFVRSDANYAVIDKIPKFEPVKGIAANYWLILLDADNNVLHTIERTDYRHITEGYGYKFNNNYMDDLNIGDGIPKGIPVKKSASFDEVDNRCDGVNLTTVYMATALTTEDPIVISESAAKKFAAPLINPVQVQINENDILLNLYGDDDNYKAFPDIGERVKGGILCGVRRERKDDEALFTQSWQRLKDIMIPDEKYTVKGTVVDINIYCNNPEKLQNSIYNQQIAKYYDMYRVFCEKVVNSVQPFISKGIGMTYDMQMLYWTCKGVIEGRQYIDDKVFNNIKMEIVVMENIPLCAGDKITDRYGGKGVISRVMPDELMPQYKLNGKWEPVDVQYNSCTVVNRENPGQEFEVSLTFIGEKIIERINKGDLTLFEAEHMIYRYMRCISPAQAVEYEQLLESMTEDDRIAYMNSMIYDGAIYMVIKPISESMSIDKLRALYHEFPWIELSEIQVPMANSNGEYRYVSASRRLPTGKKYIYRLKQFAEEKFSAVSLASTNIRSENTKSKMNKLHKTIHATTPVRFGEMEWEDLLHMRAELVIQAIMLLSTSPLARRLHKSLLVGNPFDIDVKLDKDSISRSVEIVNAYLKTCGLRLVFDKIPKKKCDRAMQLIAYRIPNAVEKTEIARRIPKFIETMNTLKQLISERNEVLNKPTQIAFRTPDYVKTQEDANMYIEDKQLSEGINMIIDLIEDNNINSLDKLKERIKDKKEPKKMIPIARRIIAYRTPNNFPNEKVVYDN
jgi:hypothetical protein